MHEIGLPPQWILHPVARAHPSHPVIPLRKVIQADSRTAACHCTVPTKASPSPSCMAETHSRIILAKYLEPFLKKLVVPYHAISPWQHVKNGGRRVHETGGRNHHDGCW